MTEAAKTGGSTVSAPAKKTGTRPVTYDHLKAQKKPQMLTCRIATDADIADAYAEAEQRREFSQMALRGNPSDEKVIEETTKADADFKKAKDAVLKNSIKFTFRAIGRKRYNALVNEHPPTEEQKQKATDNGDDPDDLEWDTDKFPPALMALSIVEPELTEAEVHELWDSDDWNAVELMNMFYTAYQVNTARGVVNLGKD